jgi:hypothetical protein
MDQPLFRRARDCRVSRISPADTNKFVMTVDPVTDKAPFLSVVEIFETGGRTPLHKLYVQVCTSSPSHSSKQSVIAHVSNPENYRDRVSPIVE